MTRAVLVCVLLVVMLLAGGPVTASADGVKIIVKSGPFHHHGVQKHVFPAHPHHKFFHSFPSVAHPFVVPRAVIVVPSRRWVPGYWSYQWVPQIYTDYQWVPGQWSPEGTWIDGHYAPRTFSSGYYQPVWVPGYWAD